MAASEDDISTSSQRRLAANRANAQRSTGPRTKSGKSKSSRNASCHGLSSFQSHDQTAQDKINRLALLICGQSAPLIEQELAMTIAECEVTLARVRSARVNAIEVMRRISIPSFVPYYLTDLELRGTIAAMRSGKSREATRRIERWARRGMFMAEQVRADRDARYLTGTMGGTRYPPGQFAAYSNGQMQPRTDSIAVWLASPQLRALDRYETRALSRRRRAMEAFRYLPSARLMQHSRLLAPRPDMQL